MTQLLSAVGIFCEDIREEKSGAETLIGIVSDNLRVPRFPYVFPRFALYVRIIFDPSSDPGPIVVRLDIPGFSEPLLNPIDADLVQKARDEVEEKGTPIATIISRMKMENLPLQEPARLVAKLMVGGEERICVVLNVEDASHSKPSPPS